MFPNRLSIIGVGLLGGSIGLAIKSLAIPCQITGYGHRRSTLDRAIELNAIDHATESIGDAVREADLTILCTPVGLLAQNLRDISPHLKAGSIVTDVGSTKRTVVGEAEKVLPATVHFVGSHPMAGSDKRGVEFARADLYRGATCILTPTQATNTKALSVVDAFWKALGMTTRILSPEEHDRRVSDISHLPHLLAAALVAMQDETSLELVGPGFIDVTRIAGGDSGLWRDILIDNRDAVLASAQNLQRILEKITELLHTENADELARWLQSVADARNALSHRKSGDLPKN